MGRGRQRRGRQRHGQGRAEGQTEAWAGQSGGDDRSERAEGIKKPAVSRLWVGKMMWIR